MIDRKKVQVEEKRKRLELKSRRENGPNRRGRPNWRSFAPAAWPRRQRIALATLNLYFSAAALPVPRSVFNSATPLYKIGQRLLSCEVIVRC